MVRPIEYSTVMWEHRCDGTNGNGDGTDGDGTDGVGTGGVGTGGVGTVSCITAIPAHEHSEHPESIKIRSTMRVLENNVLLFERILDLHYNKNGNVEGSGFGTSLPEALVTEIESKWEGALAEINNLRLVSFALDASLLKQFPDGLGNEGYY